MRILYFLFKIVLLVTLPFICLIRGAVWIHENFGLQAYLCILGGTLITVLLLVFYFTFLYGKITGRIGSFDAMQRRSFIIFIFVIGYSIYALGFLSGQHFKSKALRNEFTDLHPIVRLAISSLTLLDSDLIITDASRVPEDYKRMGLKKKSRSLHYKQRSGYSHAVDLRTKGRNEIGNFMRSMYFRIMGLNVLRHVGTDDHLHISVSSKDSPGAI